MNKNNVLGLYTGKRLLMLELKEGITVVLPTPLAKKGNDNVVRVVDVEEDGSFTAHWEENFNLDGDFSTELMRFTNKLVLDTGDKKSRNKIRKANGLVEID